MNWQRVQAAQSIDPARVENALDAIAQNWPTDAPSLQTVVEQFPLGDAALPHLLSVSSICAARLVRDPRLLLWLAQPEVCTSARGYGEMLTQLHADAADAVAADNFRDLRAWKGREMTRIALRELAGAATLAQTTAELSQIAEICLGEVYRHWDANLRQRFGAPDAELAVIGLGKLGGRELNHSSDVDIIFAYSEEGQLSPSVTYHQWFNILAERITATFSATHDAGALFRIDLRLRPEGTAGPLARSLESMENYYSGFGETWERLALVKARGVAGSRELAYEFLRQHQPFIFPKSPSRDLLDEIGAIKRRIERDVVGHEKLERDVKLGAGGIREIEFVVQALQLLHGARHAFLQESSTLRALPVLAELELLPQSEARRLLRAYEFLRVVEHRLQIEAEQQTHTIPDDPTALRRLALSLQFRSSDEFLRELNAQMLDVRSIFHRVISEPQRALESPQEQSLPQFRDPSTAQKSLGELARSRSSFHVAPRTRQVFQRLQPLLLEQLRGVADPDATLNQFIRFVDAYGLRSMLFELLVAHPRLLELLVKTFDASRYAGDLLIRRPQLLEEITRGEMLDRQFSTAAHLRRLRELDVKPASLDAVRVYRHTHGLRILLRDVLGIAELETILSEHSELAEACLVFVDQLRGSVSDLTVLALGKFGGGEIGYGADLDILFVGDNTRAAQHLMVAMAQPTPEGAIYTLDPRLRPDGETGPLTLPLEAYAAYYESRAQLWEIQSLSRARPIAGPDGARFLETAKQIWRRAGERPELLAQIGAMFQRIRRDRAGTSDELDFKAGTGGLIAAEFVVQALQMRFGVWEQNTQRAVDALTSAGHIAAEDARELMANYNFLRRIAAVLRRYDNKSVSLMPHAEVAQRHLAARVGATDIADFAERYRGARRAIHKIFTRYVG